MVTATPSYTITDFADAQALIYQTIKPTQQIRWPLLVERCGVEVWVKHENHLPTGAFKVRGGLLYSRQLKRSLAEGAGVIAATRGNHGQSVAYAAAQCGLRSTVVVPLNNNPDKNRAMRAYGAEVIEHGKDFDEALGHTRALSESRGLVMFPSFDPELVRGVGTYGIEFLQAVSDLDTVYVPIGMGSGICGMLAARDALGLDTKIVGVVAAAADTYARSFAARQPCPTDSADTIADGLAARVPNPQALASILTGVARIVTVSDAEILQAIRIYFTDTHNLAEGAGAAPLAALLKESERYGDVRVGLILSGGNITSAQLVEVLA